MIGIISDFETRGALFVAWLRLVCLSHHGCFLLILILAVLIASLCSSWADLRESTGVFGCLTSCLHLRQCWKNPQSFHFSCLSAFAKEFSRNLARRAAAIYTLQCMTARPWSGPGSDGWTLPTATSHRFIWEVKTATWLILLDWTSFGWRRRRRTGPVWLPCINYVNIQVVSLAMATGCGKHDHSPYAYPDRARCMISQIKPHFLPEMRINGPHTHAWGPEGLQASFLNTGKDRLDWAAPANNGKSASYLLSSGFPSIRSLIPLQYFSVGNFATNSIPNESVLRWHQ